MIYVRHANKSYINGVGTEFALDPEITPQGKETAKIRFRNLLTRFGIPKKIISSPYLRARETAKIAQTVILEETGKEIPIIYDSSIGEYLGHHPRANIYRDLRPETVALNPIPPESWNQYSFRIRKHSQSDRYSGWYITHGIIIQSLAFFHGIKRYYPNELEGIRIQNKMLSLI